VVVEADDPNQDLVDAVETPVSEFVESLANTIIGITEVNLDGRRNSVRTMETNEGNLIADALLWQARELAPEFGTPVPNVAIQNGGGIRNNNIIDAGTEISALTTFNMLPFSNFVSVIEPLPAAQFKEILENAVSRVESVSGRFAQVAGCTVVYDPDGTPQSLDADGNVATAGARIVSVTLADGTPIVANGELVASAPDITIATIDFLARGGDQYPYRGASFSVLGVSYQQALQNYIEDALAGEINISNYPEGGEGRITTIGSGLQGLPQTTLGNTELAFELTAAPNPTTEELVVTYHVENAGQVQLYLSNTLGQRLVTYVNVTQDAGAQQHTIQLDVPAGTYFLTVNVNGKMSTLAVVKK
jgi:5'-nucleotidase